MSNENVEHTVTDDVVVEGTQEEVLQEVPNDANSHALDVIARLVSEKITSLQESDDPQSHTEQILELHRSYQRVETMFAAGYVGFQILDGLNMLSQIGQNIGQQ